jgi:hypothetical protein
MLTASVRMLTVAVRMLTVAVRMLTVAVRMLTVAVRIQTVSVRAIEGRILSVSLHPVLPFLLPWILPSIAYAFLSYSYNSTIFSRELESSAREKQFVSSILPYSSFIKGKNCSIVLLRIKN